MGRLWFRDAKGMSMAPVKICNPFEYACSLSSHCISIDAALLEFPGKQVFRDLPILIHHEHSSITMHVGYLNA